MKTIKVLVLVYIISFALNFVWENAHAVLYTHYRGGEITSFILFRASLADALIITALALPFIFSSFFRTRLWLVIPIGIILAIIIEINALKNGYWAYNEYMPLIPFFDVGITPTIQLGLLGYITYIFTIRKK
jgi:hypothetical protein